MLRGSGVRLSLPIARLVHDLGAVIRPVSSYSVYRVILTLFSVVSRSYVLFIAFIR